LRRIRWTSPDDAGIDTTPASMANAAGDRKRSTSPASAVSYALRITRAVPSGRD